MSGRKTEVLLNQTYGGFRLSRAAMTRFNELRKENGLLPVSPLFFQTENQEQLKKRRTDPILFQVLTELREKCDPGVGPYGFTTCKLYVGAVDADSKWRIVSDDGCETIEFD